MKWTLEYMVGGRGMDFFDSGQDQVQVLRKHGKQHSL